MKNISTNFLRVAISAIGLFLLVLCIFVAPKMASIIGETFYRANLIKALILIDVYLMAIVFYFMLYQFFRILKYIDRETAFSNLSVSALKVIRICSVIITILFTLFLPAVYVIANEDDAPGLLLMAIGFNGLPIMFATIIAILEKLLLKAIEIKSENDLTV